MDTHDLKVENVEEIIKKILKPLTVNKLKVAYLDGFASERFIEKAKDYFLKKQHSFEIIEQGCIFDFNEEKRILFFGRQGCLPEFAIPVESIIIIDGTEFIFLQKLSPNKEIIMLQILNDVA